MVSGYYAITAIQHWGTIITALTKNILMKKIQVFLMGKKLCQIYPYATKWQVFKFRVRKFFRKVFLVLGLIALIVAAFQIGRVKFPSTEIVYENKTVLVDNLGTKVEELKKDLVNELRQCESSGATEEDGIIVFDSNSKASIGLLQWQKASVIHYYKVLYGKEITGKEAVMVALDYEKASQLALDVMFKTNNKAGKDWFNCNKKLGLDQKIDWIKKLQ